MALIERWSARDSDFGLAFKITGPVHLAQLDEEIKALHGWAQGAGLTAEGNLDTASTSNPVLLFVGHAGADAEKIKQAGRDHAPDPDFNRPVDASTSLLDVVHKATSGGWLTEEEVQIALRGLLARMGNI